METYSDREKFVLPFKVWVDADALPRILRDVIIRASDRYQIEITFVANQNVGITPSIRINSIQVLSGADSADQEIVDRMKAHDIVITQDIPLAAQVIEKGGIAIHPRGEIYTSANVKARLHLRDFMDTLRGAGVQTGGPPPISERDKREFSSSLDQMIQKQKRKTSV
ncbi:YaiI/YqxD family protein [Acinetobacter sp. ANC 4558]|uniref:YaiI/YqxD family protein n=1 Tax=Acinetobacter sp. ANC 4558 TaxID=1977876 RepID=UPI003A0FC842